jgi:flagellar biosynthesis/type III secretory pathway ATPase
MSLMSRRIDPFCQDIRSRLAVIEMAVANLNARIDGRGRDVERDVREHLDAVKRLVESNRAKVAEATSEITNWIEADNAATNEEIAEWTANKETAKLIDRADRADRYAAAAKDVALAALDAAEQAALEAWLARRDAESAPDK